MSAILRRVQAKVLFAFIAPVALVAASLTIASPRTALAACSIPTPNYGMATYSINVPASGTYRIWSRVIAADATNNAYMLEVDGASCYSVGDAATSSAAWTWVDYQAGTASSKISPSLTAGQHTIRIIGKEPSVKVDRIMALSDTTCVPSGTGDNCAVTSDTITPAVTITAPVENASVSGTISVATTATDNTKVQKVDIFADDVLKASLTAAPYTYMLDTSVLANGAHTVVAKAYDEAGNVGSDTTRITVKNGDSQAPAAPTGLSASTTNATKVTLTWKASTDNTAVTGYIVKRDGLAIATTTETTYVDASMAPGQSYVYTVAAYDAAGNNSSASSAVTISVPKPADTQAPTAPSNTSASAVSPSQINLSWKASTDNIAVASYDVYRAIIGGNPAKIATVTSTGYGDTGLTENTNYTYYVVAKDANGNTSAQSGEVAAKTLEITKPTPSEPAEQENLGTVRGQVTGKRGRPLSNTRIILSSDDKRYMATTNDRGVYRIDSVITGRYDVQYRADGYQRLGDRVKVRESKSTINNVRLYESGRHVRWWNRWW